jgi:hypothetical protein
MGRRKSVGFLSGFWVMAVACGETEKVPIEKGPPPVPLTQVPEESAVPAEMGRGPTLADSPEALAACVEWGQTDCERLKGCYPEIFGGESCTAADARANCLMDMPGTRCLPSADDYDSCRERLEMRSCDGYCSSAESGDGFVFCGDICIYFCGP